MMGLFEAPHFLVLAIVLPLSVATLLITAHRRRMARFGKMGSGDVIRRLVPLAVFKPANARVWTLSVAAFLAAIAVAGPRWGTTETRVSGSGIDIVLALDASLSMMANDDKPSRLERMKQEVRRLRATSGGDRIGVIAFAGRSYILTPLTTDEGALDLFLDNLDPNIVGLAGSAVSRAITQGTELLLASESASDRALVIMSDWESFDDPEEVLAAARKAQDAGINVVTVGFGTAAGSRIPMDPHETSDRFKLDETGRIVTTRYDANLMRSTAEAAGGAYVEASETDKAARVRRALSNLREQRRSLSLGVDFSPRFQLFLVPALLLVLLDTFRADRRSAGQPVAPAPKTGGGGRVIAAARRSAAAASLSVLVISPMQGRPDTTDRQVAMPPDINTLRSIKEYRRRIQDGDNSERTLYNLGTALLLADSLASARDILDRVAKSDAEELRYRALFNRGLSRLIEGRRGNGAQRDAALDEAIATYKDAILLRPDDVDAKWNYELALREKEGGGGGGGGQQQQQQPTQDNQPNESQPQDSPTGLGREQAEQILNNAARDERDVQARTQDRSRPSRPPGGKDW